MKIYLKINLVLLITQNKIYSYFWIKVWRNDIFFFQNDFISLHQVCTSPIVYLP